ncbi:MucB/RseB C-terminal domain-containing protein [Aliiglaciecola litoralis]|uniref:MucB/RseB C-terminal domain-containing protein n=1 Tax=Aliiglaciecola litoralis TaxID=582857 RepID=A0ABP3WV78_9ALTE
MQDPNAQIWLTKMAQAKQQLNYKVTFVMSRPGADPQPYLWRHAITEDGIEMEQLDQLNGPGKEVIRIGNTVSYFDSHRPPYSLQSSHISGPLPSILLTDPLSLMPAYEFVVVGKSRISGRVAQQIRMVSKDKTRFGYNLWLDQNIGLPLKISVVDLNGQKMEQIQVTELEVTPSPDPYFANYVVSATMPDVVQFAPQPKEKQNWKLDFVPIGMEQVKHSVRLLQNNGGKLEYMMLSDGLVDISVYLQRANGQVAESDIVARIGSDIYYSRTQGNVLVTVIGKIPANTANAIATSISAVQ